MKKLTAILMASVLTLAGLTGCTTKETETGGQTAGNNQTSSTYELALITDVGTIDDKSFNQGSWEGLVKYAEEKKISHKYYKPAAKNTDEYINAMDLAVKSGAKLIVCPGFLFEPAVYKAQVEYPDVTFVLLDGFPQDGNYEDFKITENTLSIFYAEQQAGFLAGYAAVKDGYRKLGFAGGMAVPAVIRFGYGYIQGADFAAKELGLAKDEVSIKYFYTGNFDATPENKTMASSWYKSGVEVIFACGGAVGNSVMAAAEEAGAVVIGVDIDQSSESDTVITSAMKGLGVSVYDAIEAYYNGKFEGGRSIVMGASEDGVGLPMETSKFKTFSKADYDKVFEMLAKDTNGIASSLANDETATSAKEVPVELVSVELIES